MKAVDSHENCKDHCESDFAATTDMSDNHTAGVHVPYMAVRNRISYLVRDYLYYSNIKLWIWAGDRYRSIQNASCRFCTLYPACPFRLGGHVAGNNQDQFKRRIKQMEVTEKMKEFMNDLIGERMEQVYQENDGKQYDPFNENWN